MAKTLKTFIQINTSKLPGIFASIGKRASVTAVTPEVKPADLKKMPAYKLATANQADANAKEAAREAREQEKHENEMQETSPEGEELHNKGEERRTEDLHKMQLKLFQAKIETEKSRAKKKTLKEEVKKKQATPFIFASIGARHKDLGEDFSGIKSTSGVFDKLDNRLATEQRLEDRIGRAENHYNGDKAKVEQKTKDFNQYTTDSLHINRSLLHLHARGIDPSDHENALNHLIHRTPNALRPAEALAEIPKLDAALKTHTIPAHETFHVYSGVSKDFNISKLRENNEKVHLPAYTSTSLDPKVAASFASGLGKDHREMLRIKIPKESQHGTFIGSATSNDQEHEFLLHRGKTIKFDGPPKIFKDKNGHGWPRNYLVHTAEIVDD